jgi:hypothetical protein
MSRLELIGKRIAKLAELAPTLAMNQIAHGPCGVDVIR